MLIRETYAVAPSMGYLNSNSGVGVEPPCGPGQLFIVCLVFVLPCAVCRTCISVIGFVPKSGSEKEVKAQRENRGIADIASSVC